MVFSKRLDWDHTANPLLRLLAAKRAAGVEILDLTESNPTRVGFDYSQVDLPAALAQTASAVYQPSPQGLLSARVAIADYYRDRGRSVDPDSLLLTASTSEAYSFLFKLLCNPGDEVLIPQPGYPLFDFLTSLDSVQPIYYSLQYTELRGWRLNFERLQAAIGDRTRAIIVVSPHNPTGSCLTQIEIEQLQQICLEHNLALIIDEVFADYQSLTQPPNLQRLASNSPTLTFTLNGLSKVVGLPQAKLGWIQISGPPLACQESLARLEFISDTYLSVSTAIQQAVPRLLADRTHIQSQIRERLATNFNWLKTRYDSAKCQLFPREGGWYAILEFQDGVSDNDRARQALERNNVFVHSGYFYDFAHDGYVVASLLTPTALFQEGIDHLLNEWG
jgi:hypothetical protein